MSLSTLLFYVFFTFFYQLRANDDCEHALKLPGISDYCSGASELNNFHATPSKVELPDCFLKEEGFHDVWFSFVAVATEINLTVQGNIENSKKTVGLKNPQLAVYSGRCGSLKKIGCISDGFGNNFVELAIGNLKKGETYFIRIGGRYGSKGSFQLCASSFEHGKGGAFGDCSSSKILCDKTSIFIPYVIGQGKELGESDAQCAFKDCSTSENQSFWLKWTCDQPGSLTFTLKPLKPQDDLDFILFDLSNVSSCGGKAPLRCMFAGEEAGEPLENWRLCMGQTGLREKEADSFEDCGCDKTKNNFLKPLIMQHKKSYALLINNYSSSGTGFIIEFGGTGTFLRFQNNDCDNRANNLLNNSKALP